VVLGVLVGGGGGGGGVLGGTRRVSHLKVRLGIDSRLNRIQGISAHVLVHIRCLIEMDEDEHRYGASRADGSRGRDI